MKNQMSNVSDQFVNLVWRVACGLWETIELILIVMLDCLARLIELILVMIKLIFQVTIRSQLHFKCITVKIVDRRLEIKIKRKRIF